MRTVLGLYWLCGGIRYLVLAIPSVLGGWRTIEIDGVFDAVLWMVAIADPLIHVVAGLCFLLRRRVVGAGIAILAFLAAQILVSLAWTSFGLETINSGRVWIWALVLWKPFLIAATVLVVLAIERER